MSNPLTNDTPPPKLAQDAVPSALERAFTLRTSLGRFFWFAIVLIGLFAKELIALAAMAANSNLHSYILLVPFVTGYLIYVRGDRLPATYESSPALGIIPFLLGLIALASIWMLPNLTANDHLTLVALSFFCFLVAGAFFFLGRGWVKAAAFPLFFLIFIVPLPDAIANLLENASKLASSEAANLFFDITGTPVMREGTFFQLPNIAIQVGQECSGIRSSLVLVLTSLVGANLFLTQPWRRALLVAFVIPLGILRNGFRVWVIGTLCIHFGPQMIHSIIHRRGGPFFFALSLIPLFLLLWWLRRGETNTVRVKASNR